MDSPNLKAPFSWQEPQWLQLKSQWSEGHLAHAYLVCGEAGLGKSQFAKNFAELMLCTNPRADRACEECSNCLLGKSSNHPDLLVLQPEEGSKGIKIEQIRALSEFVVRTSHAGIAKIVIIFQAHKLNSNAANALLKTLEEPTPNTFLFLVSDQPDAMSLTIRSRCQRLLMNEPSKSEALAWLEAAQESDNHEASLSMAAGKPLLALDLAASGALLNRQQFLAALASIATPTGGISTIPQAVTLAGKMGELAALGYLASTSSILIRYLLTNRRPAEADDKVEDLYLIFSARVKDSMSLILALMRYYQEVMQARRQLASSTNPNPQLLIESLLWHWSKLALQK